MLPQISIIIPVYNEEKSILRVINELKSLLIKYYKNDEIEVIVVNDGSRDNTAEILASIDGISLYNHSVNRGYGSALKTGIRCARGSYILILDADNTYPIDLIPKLIKNCEVFDMVVGARALSNENFSMIRKPAKYIIGQLANYLAGFEIPDLNSGFRIFRKDIADKYFKILPDGFSFTTTITLAMLCNGYNVNYIPIDYYSRIGKSKFRPINDTFNLVGLIWRTVMYFNPLKVLLPFVIVSLVCTMISIFFDIYYYKDFTDKTIILFLAFIQISILTLLADIIDKRS